MNESPSLVLHFSVTQMYSQALLSFCQNYKNRNLARSIALIYYLSNFEK